MTGAGHDQHTTGIRSDMRQLVAERFGNVLVDAHYPEISGHVSGKVRDNYDLADGRRILVATDRQSAFDQVLAAVPFKGQVLTATARFWFDATRRHRSEITFSPIPTRTSRSPNASA